ncbi:PepSY-associated TM helix domain-containing protein [Sphingomonas sp. MMS24-J13]|uniref:PepSY-associated TM helix domain-containing protein n=1 Tax=Sphingomonas sp. MMS24-J13 TaxID=3238686 RepID=UPI00384E4E3D
MSRPIEQPRRGLWRTEIVRAVLSGHSILGIAFAAMIYIVCLSGTLSVFMRDFERWEQPDVPVMRAVSDTATARAIEAMGRRAGPEKSFYVSLPSADLPRLILSSGGDADDETWIADKDGRLAVEQEAPWTDFITELHAQLHLAKGWGRFIVGLTGVALLSSLISGVLAHPRILRDAFHLRLGGSRRLEQADLHNRLGVWPLPFHLLVSLTGALLGLSTIIVGVLALLMFRGDTSKVYALLSAAPAAVDARPAPMPNVAMLLATVRELAPEARAKQISISHWGRQDMRFEVSAARPRLIAAQDSMIFDAAGDIVAEKHPAGLTVGEKILGSLGQLHFGWFGGVPIRIAYGLLGLALCVVTSSGISIWLARRRDKGRSGPGWERLWAAVSWGQPVAIAATATIALILPARVSASLLIPAWVALTLLLPIGAAAAVTTTAAALARWARVVTGLLLCTIVAVHGATWLQKARDPAGFVIDIVALGAAILLVRPRLFRRTG